jgi:putative acetyltransferase
MGVIGTHGGAGIGARLLSEVTTRARALGVRRLELEVFRSNVAAIALYKRSGFQLEGELLRARILDDMVDDLLLMSRWLDVSTVD